MGIYFKDDGFWKGLGDAWTPTLSFNGNGSSGTMPTYSGFGTLTIPANAFTMSGSKFLGWNTAPDGSGTSYASGQEIDLRNDLTLYAQWKKAYTITYYKIYNHDYPSIYPPASNTGPVTNDSDGRYLLELNVNGVRVDGLMDKFTVDDKYSPSRTITVDEGSTVYIYVGNDYSGAYSKIYLNGEVIRGASVDASYEFTVSSNLTITFTWETEGIVYINPQSYWNCSITTS